MTAPEALVRALVDRWESDAASVLADWCEEQRIPTWEILRAGPSAEARALILHLACVMGVKPMLAKDVNRGWDWASGWVDLPKKDIELVPLETNDLRLDVGTIGEWISEPAPSDGRVFSMRQGTLERLTPPPWFGPTAFNALEVLSLHVGPEPIPLAPPIPGHSTRWSRVSPVAFWKRNRIGLLIKGERITMQVRSTGEPVRLSARVMFDPRIGAGGL